MDDWREFQTLIAGFLAIFAAMITAWVIWRSANRPVEAQEKRNRAKEDRRLRHGCVKLSHELQILHHRARKVEAEIKMQIKAMEAGTGRVGLKVSLPKLRIIMDWKVMSLMSSDICERCFTLLGQTEDHNNDISNAVPGFIGDEFRNCLFKRLQGIQQDAQLLARNVKLHPQQR